MPDAEDGAGHGCHRREICGSERGAKATVLHADFDGQRLALVEIEPERLGGEEAEQVPEAVVQDNDGEDQKAGLRDCALAGADNGRDDQHDTDDAYERQGRHGLFDQARQHLLCQEAQRQWQDDDLQNAHEHRHGVYGQVLACEHPDEEGRDYRSCQGGDAGAGDAQRYVALGEIGHHVARCAAGAAADENDAGGNFRRHRDEHGQEQSERRHDDEMRDDADRDLDRAVAQFAEVIDGDGQAHAEHYDAEQRDDIGRHMLEHIRQQEAEHGEQDDPEGECLADKRGE